VRSSDGRLDLGRGEIVFEVRHGGHQDLLGGEVQRVELHQPGHGWIAVADKVRELV